MADSTINGLTALAAASVVPGTDVAPVWQGSASTTKKVTIADLVTAGNTFGTITASSPATISQTWNNGATTFTGLLANITDTASNALSLLQDLQVGGTSKFKVDKTGLITTGAASGSMAFGTTSSTGFYVQGANLGYQSGGNKLWLSAANQFTLVAAARLSWVSGSDPNGNEDVFLYRDAANNLAQRNGTTAQGLRVYNTFTDASNYERGVFDWTTTANTLTVATKAAGTGVARDINLTSAANLFCTASTGVIQFITAGANNIQFYSTNVIRWQIAAAGAFIPGADATYDLGSASASVRQLYLSKTVTAAGTTGAQTINKATGSVNFAAAATSLVVTNSLVTTSSVIVATVGTNDTTMKTVNAVAAAGSFTLNANAAATAETRVNFVVLN